MFLDGKRNKITHGNCRPDTYTSSELKQFHSLLFLNSAVRRLLEWPLTNIFSSQLHRAPSSNYHSTAGPVCDQRSCGHFHLLSHRQSTADHWVAQEWPSFNDPTVHCPRHSQRLCSSNRTGQIGKFQSHTGLHLYLHSLALPLAIICPLRHHQYRK